MVEDSNIRAMSVKCIQFFSYDFMDERMQFEWEMGLPNYRRRVAPDLLGQVLPQPHLNLTVGRDSHH